MATTIDGQAIVQAILGYAEGVTRDRWHRYHLNGKRLPATTKITGMLDKSRPLMKWSAEMQQAADIAASWELRDMLRDPFVSACDSLAWECAMREAAPAHRKAQEELARASEHGRQVHALIEHHIRERLGQKLPQPDASLEAMMGFDEWLEWEQSSGFVPLMTEAFVISKRHGFCGQIDSVPALIKGKPAVYVFDWKTSSSPDPYTEQLAQNAGYRVAVKEALKAAGIKARVCGAIVQIPKDGKAVHVTTLDNAKENAAAEKAFLALLKAYPWYESREKAGLEAWKARKAAEREQ